MDILKFIDSEAIREHLKSIDYKPKSSAEAAFIVNQSERYPLKDKFEAWEWIIENMDDMDTLATFERIYYYDDNVSDEAKHSLRLGLKKYIETTKSLIQIAKTTEEGTAFSYSYYCHGDSDYEEDKRLFTTYEGVDEAINYTLFAMSDENIECANLSKRWLDKKEADYKEVILKLLPDGEIMHVYYNYSRECFEGIETAYLDLFSEMWFDIPTPFKKGDILCEKNYVGRSRGIEPMVLENICYWGCEDIESERKRHAWGDMDMFASGYFMYDDGDFYADCMHNYLALDYYREELVGNERIAKVLSNYLKDEINLELAMKAYHIIKQEEMLETLKKERLGFLDDWLMNAGLLEETIEHSLDKYIKHFYPGRLYTIAGRPGMGKTTVAINLAKEFRKIRRDVTYVQCDSPVRKIAKGLEEAYDRRVTYVQCEKTATSDIEMCLRGVADYKYEPEIAIEKFEEIIKNSKNHIFIVDSFNHIHKDGKDRAERLKELAEKYNVVIIALSSVMRTPEHRRDKHPKKADMPQALCDKLWDVSDAVVFLYREKFYNDELKKDAMEFNVAKAEQETGMFKLDFDRLFEAWRIERK